MKLEDIFGSQPHWPSGGEPSLIAPHLGSIKGKAHVHLWDAYRGI